MNNMNKTFANSETLGYACFFIIGWLISMVYAGWFSLPILHKGVILIMILGGVILAIAGIFSYFDGNTLNTSLFLVFGAFLFSLSLTSIMYSGSSVDMFSGFSAWIFIVFAVFVLYLWIASFGGGIIQNLFLLGLWLTLLALAIANWTSSGFVRIVGGYIGLVTSLLAGYLSAVSIGVGNFTKRNSTTTGETTAN